MERSYENPIYFKNDDGGGSKQDLFSTINRLAITFVSSALLSISTLSFADEQKSGKGLDCTQLTVTEMKKALESNKITSEQCVQQVLNKINRVSPHNDPFAVVYTGDNLVSYNTLIAQFEGLNAFASINASAIMQARQADKLRKGNVKKSLPLLGIPIAVKDQFAVANLGLTNAVSTISLLPYTPTVNDSTVQAFIDAGAIIIGKTNMSDGGSLTGINFQFGLIQNAYDQARISGGSSAGSSAAVAARLVPATVDADLAGSVRVPESLNGVIGYRPSFGRYTTLANPCSYFGIPNDPLITMNVTGLTTRSISDIVLLDKVIMAANAVQVKESTKLKGLRLGVPNSFYLNLDPALKVVVDKALNRLKKEGAILIHTPDIPGLDPGVVLPIGFMGNLVTVGDLYQKRVFLALDSLINTGIPLTTGLTYVPVSPDLIASVALVTALVNGTFPTLADKLSFNEDVLLPLTAASFANYQNYFAVHRLDAVIYPTTRLPAKTFQEVIVNGGNPFTNGLFDFAVTLPDGTITGSGPAYSANSLLAPLFAAPSLTMPIGLTADLHLPVGMQIEGLPGEDSRVLEIGSAFEKVFQIPAPASAE